MPTKDEKPTTEASTTETVSIETAVNRLAETCTRIADRVTIVEDQVAEIYKNITEVKFRNVKLTFKISCRFIKSNSQNTRTKSTTNT